MRRGIALRSPLSPLLGALYLLPLDRAMAKLDVEYVRYMDDWLITAPRRWQLRRHPQRDALGGELLGELAGR